VGAPLARRQAAVAVEALLTQRHGVKVSAVALTAKEYGDPSGLRAATSGQAPSCTLSTLSSLQTAHARVVTSCFGDCIRYYNEDA
jgi:hypothetical protein